MQNFSFGRILTTMPPTGRCLIRIKMLLLIPKTAKFALSFLEHNIIKLSILQMQPYPPFYQP